MPTAYQIKRSQLYVTVKGTNCLSKQKGQTNYQGKGEQSGYQGKSPTGYQRDLLTIRNEKEQLENQDLSRDSQTFLQHMQR